MSLPPLIPGDWKKLEGDDAFRLGQRYADSLSLSFMRNFGAREFRQVDGIRAMPLACYPRHLLCEVGLEIRGTSMVSAFLFGAEGLTILDGTSHLIHDLNLRISLNLGTEAAALDYTRFFGSAVHGEEGRFQFLTMESELEPFAATEFAKLRHHVRLPVVTRNGATWMVKGTVRYGRHLFHSTFDLQSNGLIEMVQDEGIDCILPCGPDMFDNLSRGAPICAEGN